MKGGFDVKVRSSVKPICEKCKIIKRKNPEFDKPLKEFLRSDYTKNILSPFSKKAEAREKIIQFPQNSILLSVAKKVFYSSIKSFTSFSKKPL